MRKARNLSHGREPMNGKQGIEEMRTTAYNFKPTRWIDRFDRVGRSDGLRASTVSSGEGLNTHMLTGRVVFVRKREGDGG